MWAEAVQRFSQPPFSSGSDAIYERVKAELRATYGQGAINSSNKARGGPTRGMRAAIWIERFDL